MRWRALVTRSFISLASCIHLPAMAAPPALSVEGLNQNSLVRVGGFYLTRSAVLTQGVEEQLHVERRAACADQRVRLLLAKNLQQVTPEEICTTASKALAFSVAQSGGQRVSVEIRVVPPRVAYSSNPWRIGRFPKLVLVAPELGTSEATLANVADLVAHEVFHVAMIAAGHEQLATDEEAAYRFGLCGQLLALGVVSPSAMPGYSLESSDPSIASSSSAAERVRSELMAKSGERPITVNEPLGQELLAACQEVRPN